MGMENFRLAGGILSRGEIKERNRKSNEERGASRWSARLRDSSFSITNIGREKKDTSKTGPGQWGH